MVYAGFCLAPTAGVLVVVVVVVLPAVGFLVVVVVVALGPVVDVGAVSKTVKGVPSLSLTALGLANMP